MSVVNFNGYIYFSEDRYNLFVGLSTKIQMERRFFFKSSIVTFLHKNVLENTHLKIRHARGPHVILSLQARIKIDSHCDVSIRLFFITITCVGEGFIEMVKM